MTSLGHRKAPRRAAILTRQTEWVSVLAKSSNSDFRGDRTAKRTSMFVPRQIHEQQTHGKVKRVPRDLPLVAPT